MDALAEANYAAQEVDSAIRIGGDVALRVDVDEEELENEWKALVQDVRADAVLLRHWIYLFRPLPPQSVVTQPNWRERGSDFRLYDWLCHKCD